jgi:UPF0755 protein
MYRKGTFMAEQPPWEDIFSPSSSDSDQSHPKTSVLPVTRREAREQDRGRERLGEELARARRPRRRYGGLIAFLLVLALLIGGGVATWFAFEDRIRDFAGWAEPNDYEGSGNGKQVTIVVANGDIGADVAATLEEAGVTKSFDAFYDMLVLLPEQPNFLPGTYALEGQMSAEAALDALLDPENRTISQISLPEGVTTATILERTSDATGVPLEELRAIADDYTSLGVPKGAPSIEGYLFPATYEFDPGTPARDILQKMVDRMFEALDDAGVAPEDRHRVLTIAALAQREAGNADDLGKVARVVYNRLDADMMLQFDSTSHYGYQVSHGEEPTGSVFTTDEERADDNGYNTYAKTGLPIGPIAAPGEAAIKAAINPPDGDWIYFVAVNLETGESVFSETMEQHEAAVEQLHEWCANEAHADFCG